VAEHYNLYYILLEDKRNNPMPEARNRQIRQNLEAHYRRLYRDARAGGESGTEEPAKGPEK